jgi:hypothetical protein
VIGLDRSPNAWRGCLPWWVTTRRDGTPRRWTHGRDKPAFDVVVGGEPFVQCEHCDGLGYIARRKDPDA